MSLQADQWPSTSSRTGPANSCHGPSLTTASFRMAQKPRMVFMFLNDWKKNQKQYFVICEIYMKHKLYKLLNKVLVGHSPMFLEACSSFHRVECLPQSPRDPHHLKPLLSGRLRKSLPAPGLGYHKCKPCTQTEILPRCSHGTERRGDGTLAASRSPCDEGAGAQTPPLLLCYPLPSY